MIWLSLFLAILAFCLPSPPLLVFAPFCMILLKSKGRSAALWAAALSGLVYDLFSQSGPFGLYSFNYCLATLVLSFLPNRSLFLQTATFSSLFALIHLILFQSFLTKGALLSDLLLMPLVDGAFAFFWFHCPLMLYTKLNESPRHRHRSGSRS